MLCLFERPHAKFVNVVLFWKTAFAFQIVARVSSRVTIHVFVVIFSPFAETNTEL